MNHCRRLAVNPSSSLPRSLRAGQAFLQFSEVLKKKKLRGKAQEEVGGKKQTQTHKPRGDFQGDRSQARGEKHECEAAEKLFTEY